MAKVSENHSKSEENLQQAAAEARELLGRVYESNQPLTMLISESNEQHEIKLPASVVSDLITILEAVSAGQVVKVARHDTMLTTQEVADMLRVSRRFVTKIIDSGTLPCQVVDTHRRIKFADVNAYKTRIDRKRSETLDELVAQAEELDLGY